MNTLYALPKKVEFDSSQAKWALQSTQAVLVTVGLQALKSFSDFEESELSEHIIALVKKAKSLDIQILDLNEAQLVQAMMALGDFVAQHKQIILTGYISPSIKALIQHISSISTQICIVNDAIYIENKTKHIQWVNSCVALNLHHMNTQSVLRLWSLSAPSDFILSDQGILLAVAEQLDVEPLEIDPYQDLRRYGLDSVAIVSLVGLWRANGAHIRYEDFEQSINLVDLLRLLKQ